MNQAISVTLKPREHFMTKDQLIAENKQLRQQIDSYAVRVHNDALRLKKAKKRK